MVALLVTRAGGRQGVLREGDGIGALVLDLAGAEGVWSEKGKVKEEESGGARWVSGVIDEGTEHFDLTMNAAPTQTQVKASEAQQMHTYIYSPSSCIFPFLPFFFRPSLQR